MLSFNSFQEYFWVHLAHVFDELGLLQLIFIFVCVPRDKSNVASKGCKNDKTGNDIDISFLLNVFIKEHVQNQEQSHSLVNICDRYALNDSIPYELLF